jgi:hypothetical protein
VRRPTVAASVAEELGEIGGLVDAVEHLGDGEQEILGIL